MSLRLFSQVNDDSDLIEAWLNYYLRLGVDSFHLIVHGPPAENQKLLAIKANYPITFEDAYQGPFPEPISTNKSGSTEKKKRLDALLARHTGQWVLLVDSDEFVEFPYQDIPETIGMLERAKANLMAAPMLQRLKADGSLDSPPVIEDPFKVFPLCSVDLYRRMGIKSEIFKFPLFYCEHGTELVEEGNHNPPLGLEPKAAGIVGVTHHFKFRQRLSQRLEKRVNSAHNWRNDSISLQEYLIKRSNRLPLDGAFHYSKEELIRRRLLRRLPVLNPASQKSNGECFTVGKENSLTPPDGALKSTSSRNDKPKAQPPGQGKKIMFVLPKATEFGGIERHLLELLSRLPQPLPPPTVVCFDRDIITARMDQEQHGQQVVKCVKEPRSLWDWLRIIRKEKPDTIVFLYNSIEAFPWQAPLAAALAGVRKRISIQHLIPPPLPLSAQAKSPRDLLRRLIGRQARNVLKLKTSARISSYLSSTTVCVSNAVRNALVNVYGFRPGKTIVVLNGVSTSNYSASKTNGAVVRTRLDIDPEEFVLVCAARLVEEKGIDVLIRAVSRVVRQGVPCKCIILGDGPLREQLQQKVNLEGLWDYVFFEGFQPDVRPYLQAASAFILTSYLEGLPISILEAMASGLPCIVTNVGGNAEAIENGVTGLVIPPGSAEAAADAIVYLATNPEKRLEMAGKTREVVQRLFDLDKTMSELVGLISH
jgi:glycosyltransferase involved in cell wall biosynthesis